MKRNRILKRFIWWGIPTIAVLLIVVYGFVSFTILSGITAYERKFQEDLPAAYGLVYEDVEFESRIDKVNLSGWYIAGKSEAPTLIFVHGIGGVRSADNLVELASRVAAQGYGVLMFDLRCHGSSEGELISAGYFERFDLLGAFDFLVDRGLPPEHIGVLGVSMGAAVSVLAAADEPAICALVVDSPYARASDLIAQETASKTDIPEWMAPVFLPGVKILALALHGIDIGALVPEEAVRSLKYPILIIHGTGDTRIPSDHGERIHKAAHRDSNIWLVPEVDHVDAYITYPDEYVDRILDYFDRRLDAR
jgi:pimeloyl-ACP methyl ester carboxylesterase